MAWTTPRTWTTGEVVTAAIMNTHVRDNLEYLRAHHGVRAFKSSNQTVTAGSNDVVSWDSEDYDTDAIHSTVTNNSRFIVPTGFGGYWRVRFEAQVDPDTANHNGRYVVILRKNAAGNSAGGTLLNNKDFPGHADNQMGDVEWEGSLSAADYVEAFFRSITEARVIESGTTASTLQFVYMGN